jgi:ribosomal protein S6--L-glutamate ligase
MTALEPRFASVDIVVVDGAWQVLEVNSSVCLEHFSAHSPETFDMARRVYSSAIERIFT